MVVVSEINLPLAFDREHLKPKRRIAFETAIVPAKNSAAVTCSSTVPHKEARIASCVMTRGSDAA